MKNFSFSPYHTRCINAQNETEAREIIAECVSDMNTYIAENHLLEQIRQGVATLHKEVDKYYSLKVA